MIELGAAWLALLRAFLMLGLYWWIEWQHEKRIERERREDREEPGESVKEMREIMKEIKDSLNALQGQEKGITNDKSKDKE